MTRYDQAVNDLSCMDSNEVGFLLSSTRNAINAPDVAQQKKLEEKLEHLVNGLVVVHLFAIFEE